MIKLLVYTVLTIIGIYLGYVFGNTPGLDAEAAWTCLVIFCGVLALDVVEFRNLMRREGK